MFCFVCERFEVFPRLVLILILSSLLIIVIKGIKVLFLFVILFFSLLLLSLLDILLFAVSFARQLSLRRSENKASVAADPRPGVRSWGGGSGQLHNGRKGGGTKGDDGGQGG